MLYSCDVQAEFSASLLQSSESESIIILICWFCAQEMSLKNSIYLPYIYFFCYKSLCCHVWSISL